MKRLPDFIIGGVQKSGTTFLYSLLKNHHHVEILGRSMEHSFFDDDRIYSKGIEWYKNLFHGLNNSKDVKVGQISADCSFNSGSIERIHHHIPNAKLIFVLRHPVDRALSQYWFMYANAAENKSINFAFRNERKRVSKSYQNYKIYSYVGRSKYKTQFDNVYSFFDEEKVLIIPFECLIKSTLDTINVVCEFLEISKVRDLVDLNIDQVSRNKAKLPINHFVVQFSYYFSKIGLKSIGKRVLNQFRKEREKPHVDEEIESFLNEELNEDVEFYEEVLRNFKDKKSKQNGNNNSST